MGRSCSGAALPRTARDSGDHRLSRTSPPSNPSITLSNRSTNVNYAGPRRPLASAAPRKPLLETKVGSPSLLIKETTYDDQRVPIECTFCCFGAIATPLRSSRFEESEGPGYLHCAVSRGWLAWRENSCCSLRLSWSCLTARIAVTRSLIKVLLSNSPSSFVATDPSPA